jgi:hypothetical protein
VIDRGAAYFGRQSAAAIGVVCAIFFLGRGEQLVVSLVGAILSFGLGAGWVLLNGRLRHWLLFRSEWPQQVQTIVLASSFVGIPLMLIVGAEYFLTR